MDGLKSFVLFALALFILAPNVFIHYQKAIAQITIEARDTHPGADGLGWLGNMNFYLHDFLSYANILMVLLAIIGVIGIVKTRKYELLVFFYGFVYCIILSKLALHWGRWGLPMYTLPLLLAAFGIGYLWQVQKWKRTLRPLVIFAVCLSTAWSLLFSLSISINLTYQDTRVAAFNYCKETGITEENTIYEGYTPFLPGKFKTFDAGELKSSTKYVILSSNMYHRFYLEPTKYRDQIAQYDLIKNKSYPA